ncbi:MAG: hypothetical protein JWN64_413 [Parcubacteria group bacterium]|nr:hypothetical protein [Parcubacteria group bacterium]
MEGPNINNPEKKQDKILSSQEVLDAISQYAEGFTPGRELSDEQGVYLREVEVKGEKEGEMTEYRFMRKGKYPNRNGTKNAEERTLITAIFYIDGVPVGSESIAEFNEETGEWRKM